MAVERPSDARSIDRREDEAEDKGIPERMRRTKSVSNQPALVRGCSNQAKDNGYRKRNDREVVTGWNNVPGDPYPIPVARQWRRG